MAFELQQIVPWGRCFDEYRLMFDMNTELISDRNAKFLGCGDGPASFNAEASEKGWQVTSVDPIYQFSRIQISDRINEIKEDVLQKTQQHAAQFNWKYIRDINHLEQLRLGAMRRFLDDFEKGKDEGRYIHGALPTLPFENQSFDFALVSHLLFLYSELMDFDFHLKALQELLRVANEIRVFPLQDLNAQKSIHLEPITNLLSRNFDIEIRVVPYEFQVGGNEMLILKHR